MSSGGTYLVDQTTGNSNPIRASGALKVDGSGVTFETPTAVARPPAATNMTCDVYVQDPAGNSVTLVTNWVAAPTTVMAYANGVLL